MRIASSQYAANVVASLNDDQSQLSQLLTKLSTGQQYTLPSENPVASVRLLRLSREQANLDQYQSNIGSLKDKLTQSESYLDGVSNDLLSVRDQLVSGANGSNSSGDLNDIGQSIVPLMDSILFAANTKDAEGHYLFSGTLSNTQAVTYDSAAAVGSRYTFTGNTQTQQVTVGNGLTQPSNVTLPTIADVLNALDVAQTALQDPAASANDPVTHAQLSTAMNTLDSVLDDVSSSIASIGGTQNIIDTLNSNLQNVSLANQNAALDVGQLDYADAETKLSGYNTALQATQKAYASVSQLSLFDIIPA